MNDSFCSTVTTYTKGSFEIQSLLSTADETHIHTSTLRFETCSMLKTYLLIFCGFFLPMNFVFFVINQTVFQHMQ